MLWILLDLFKASSTMYVPNKIEEKSSLTSLYVELFKQTNSFHQLTSEVTLKVGLRVQFYHNHYIA